MTKKLKRIILLTGRSGVGKTSILLKALGILKAKGYEIGGMVSREAREHGVRVGFEIVDVGTGRKGWLAHIEQPSGPRVGKYRVDLSDLDAIGTASIFNAVENADIIVVDEIGPMELFSSGFKEAVMKTLKSTKMMIGTLHYRVRDPLINALKAEGDAEILEITPENRGGLHSVLVDSVLQFMQRQR